MYSSCPIPMWQLDRNMAVISCNKAAHEFSANPMEMLEPSLIDELKTAIDSNANSVSLKGINDHWYKWQWTKDDKGICLSASDITDLVETTEFYKKLARTDQLEVHPEAIKKQDNDKEHILISAARMAVLGEIAGGIAHEINNPLTIMQGTIRSLRKCISLEKELSSSAEMNEELDDLLENMKRISIITQSLTKLSQGSNQDPLSKTNISNVIQTTLGFCLEKMKSKKIDLQLNINDIEVECRDTQIAQVILSLLNNAIDAIDGQSISWIKISTNLNGDNIEIRVQDSGAGVPKEIATKIMQPFFTTKESGKGVGLGLPIAHSIATAHNGRLLVDYTESPSCFLLEMPLKQPGNATN